MTDSESVPGVAFRLAELDKTCEAYVAAEMRFDVMPVRCEQLAVVHLGGETFWLLMSRSFVL